ncbi:MAG: glutathionylspermidine synthase family protein, partial [Reyranella sp.]|nr:glutathionylspermidine synthase family protein [Reyranella sp.]
MRRESVTPRPGWQRKLDELGFDFYMLEGKAYWTEQACYAFSSDEIDELDAATEVLHGLCLNAVEHVVANKLWERMRITPAWGDYIERVWRRGDPTLVGRFDLAYDGKSPPKLLEYNADTPTALYEAAVVQWYWLKDVKPDADQFNSIHEKLIDAWRGILRRLPPEALVHFARFDTHPEDLATSEYLRDTALQAGLAGKPLPVAQIGWNGRRFTDPDEMPIQVMNKLYPWEWMAREAFGAHVLTDTTAFIEPAWKMILS